MSTAELEILINVADRDLKEAIRTLRVLTRTAESMGVKTAASGDAASLGLRKLEKQSLKTALSLGVLEKRGKVMGSSLRHHFLGLTAIIAGTTGTGLLGSIIGAGFGFDDLKQRANIAFKKILGDAKLAKKVVAGLVEFAPKTPFEVKGIIRAAQQLIAMGTPLRRLKPELQGISDAVAALGADPVVFNRIVLAFGEMQSKGLIMAKEMRQLGQAGVPAWEILAHSMHMTVQDAMHAVMMRTVPADFGIAALQQGIEERFGGLAEEKSHAFVGVVARLKTFFRVGSGAFMQPFFNASIKGMDALNAKLSSPGGLKTLREDGQKAYDIFKKLIDFLKGEWPNVEQTFKDAAHWLERAAHFAGLLAHGLSKVPVLNTLFPKGNGNGGSGGGSNMIETLLMLYLGGKGLKLGRKFFGKGSLLRTTGRTAGRIAKSSRTGRSVLGRFGGRFGVSAADTAGAAAAEGGSAELLGALGGPEMLGAGILGAYLGGLGPHPKKILKRVDHGSNPYLIYEDTDGSIKVTFPDTHEKAPAFPGDPSKGMPGQFLLAGPPKLKNNPFSTGPGGLLKLNDLLGKHTKAVKGDESALGFWTAEARKQKKLLDATTAAAGANTDALKAQTAAADAAFSVVTSKIDNEFDSATQRLLDNLKVTVKVGREMFTMKPGDQTPAERELAALDKIEQKRTFKRDIQDAREQLATARQIGDPKAIRDAQRQLEDSMTEKKRYFLERRAEAERKAADKAIAQAQKELQAQRDLLKEHLDNSLKMIQQNIDKGLITGSQARKKIMTLLRKYGVDLGTMGKDLGKAFVTGLNESLRKLYRAANRVYQTFKKIASLKKKMQEFAKAAGDALGNAAGSSKKPGTSPNNAPYLPGGRKPRHFASGGPVPGAGNDDSVLALLTPGEYVLSKKQRAYMKKLLHHLTPQLAHLLLARQVLAQTGHGSARPPHIEDFVKRHVTKAQMRKLGATGVKTLEQKLSQEEAHPYGMGLLGTHADRPDTLGPKGGGHYTHIDKLIVVVEHGTPAEAKRAAEALRRELQRHGRRGHKPKRGRSKDSNIGLA